MVREAKGKTMGNTDGLLPYAICLAWPVFVIGLITRTIIKKWSK